MPQGKADEHIQQSAPWTDLWVDIQDAGTTSIDHLVDRVDFGAVKVAIVLAMLQVTALLDVHLHLFPCHKTVVLAVFLLFSGTARRNWR